MIGKLIFTKQRENDFFSLNRKKSFIDRTSIKFILILPTVKRRLQVAKPREHIYKYFKSLFEMTIQLDRVEHLEREREKKDFNS